ARLAGVRGASAFPPGTGRSLSTAEGASGRLLLDPHFGLRRKRREGIPETATTATADWYDGSEDRCHCTRQSGDGADTEPLRLRQSAGIACGRLDHLTPFLSKEPSLKHTL